MNKLDKYRIGAQFENLIVQKICTKLQTEHQVFYNLKVYSYMLQKTTQVDIILLTRFGIFVIEAKNFKSKLKGNYSDRMWTGNSGRYYTKIINPVLQNRMHIRAIKRAMRCYTPNIPLIQSFIVIPNDCKYEGNCKEVVTISELFTELQHLSVIREKYINMNKMKRIIRNMEERV